MRKSLVFILSVLLLVFLGCTKKTTSVVSEEEDKIIVGFSQIGAESAWRMFNTKSIQSAAEEENIQLLYSNAEQKQENQIKAIRSFIMYQVDVIMFVPIVQSGWDNVLREAKAASIPVLICDRQISTEDENLYAGYIGSDSEKEGREAAYFLMRKFKDLPGPFSILEMRGTDGSSASDNRVRGFHSVIDKDERFSVVYSESGDFIRSRGEEIARNLLKNSGNTFSVNDKKIDILFSANDGMTLGFLDVLSQTGLDSISDLTVVSVDGQQEAIEKLKAGEINCIVECNPDLGPTAMHLCKMLASGEAIPRVTNINERVFSEYDDLTNLVSREY